MWWSYNLSLLLLYSLLLFYKVQLHELALQVTHLQIVFLLLHLMKVLNRVFRCAKLSQDGSRLSYCRVPVFLQVKYHLPDCQGDEWRIDAEDVQILADFDLVLVQGLILCLGILIIVILKASLCIKHLMLLIVIEVHKAALVIVEIAKVVILGLV